MLKDNDKKLYDLIQKEAHRQDEEIELIASENYVSRDVLEANASILTNKYSE
jgi:glycine hydroxymethyltransferase